MNVADEQSLAKALQNGVLTGDVEDGHGNIVEHSAALNAVESSAPLPLSEAEHAELRSRLSKLSAKKEVLADLVLAIASAEAQKAQLVAEIAALKAQTQERINEFGASRALGAGWTLDPTTGTWRR